MTCIHVARGRAWVVSEKEARCYVGAEKEGSPESRDHQSISEERNSGSIFRKEQVQVREKVPGSTGKMMCCMVKE